MANKAFKKKLSFGNRTPQPYNDLVILNVGEDPDTRKDGEITAFAKTDGHVVWAYHLPSKVDNCLVIGDGVYITYQDRMIVLDAQTGKERLNQPMGFDCEAQYIKATLFYHDNQLLAISSGASSIRIFSEDSKTLIQAIQIPEPYYPAQGVAPLVNKDKLYLTLSTPPTLKGIRGLLILSPTQADEAPHLEIAERPPFQIITTEEADGAHEIIVSISHPNLEDILRYSEITLKEISQMRGYQVWDSPQQDLKWNGKIELIVDPTPLPKTAERDLQTMLTDLETWLDDMGIYSGDKKHNIKISLEMK